MTTQKYLYRANWLRNTIMSQSAKVTAREGMAMNMVVPTDREPVQTSPRDKMCDIMSEWADDDTELQRFLDDYRRIVSEINSIDVEYGNALLFKRYCLKQSMKNIAVDLNVSRSTLYRIHRNALAEFEEKYQAKYRKLTTF